MDSVALFMSREQALNLIQSLKESKEKCESDGRRVMAKNYARLEEVMRAQYEVAQSIRENMDRNGGDYSI